VSDGLARAAAVLKGATEVAIACHVNPDADALGATLGLSLFLRSRGVATVCSFPNEPFELPRWALELPGREALVEPSAFPKRPAVMVTCDVASMDRLGMLTPSANRAGELIWIDHHQSNDGPGTVPLVGPEASSTPTPCPGFSIVTHNAYLILHGKSC
jgi:phosphoesterase RecJ-like protein